MEIYLKAINCNSKTMVHMFITGVHAEYKKVKAIDIQIGNKQAVIFHMNVKNGSAGETMRQGNKAFLLSHETDSVGDFRVFYWNDDEPIEESHIDAFRNCLEEYDSNTQGEIGVMDCNFPKEPKEAGNGGVVGVIQCN